MNVFSLFTTMCYLSLLDYMLAILFVDKSNLISDIRKYFINNNLNESLHSAHKSGHSTDTALVRVKNHIMTSIVQGKPVLLVLPLIFPFYCRGNV